MVSEKDYIKKAIEEIIDERYKKLNVWIFVEQEKPGNRLSFNTCMKI